MSRKIDVKALVSHIVQGDGADKCRICMGDTSEGQVYLSDTVMLDGDRPVTLSELLETIAGIEVTQDSELPPGACHVCYKSAKDAYLFRNRCLESASEWHKTMMFLNSSDISETNKTMYCVIKKSIIFKDHNKVLNLTAAADRLTSLLIYRNDSTISDSILEEKVNVKCPDCRKEFVSPYFLFVHLKDASHKRACYICAEIVSKDQLLHHLDIIHKVKPYNCMLCNAFFNTRKKYKKHIEKDHAIFNQDHKDVQCLQCPGCDIYFQNRKCYVYHIKMCRDFKMIKQYQNNSIEKFKAESKNNTPSRLMKLDLSCSTNKKCYCDYCGKMFAERRFVAAHIQIVHTKTTHKPCIHCGKHYAAARMSDHIKTHQNKIYKCQYCALELKTKLGYQQHIRLHTGERPYSCLYCSEKFAALSRRTEHVRRVHLRSAAALNHSCNMCLARFKVPYRLRKHMASIHGVIDKHNVFECSICGLKFSRTGLVHHMKKHQRFDVYL